MVRKLWKNCFFLTWNLRRIGTVNYLLPRIQCRINKAVGDIYIPSVEDYGRKDVDEEELLVEPQDVRVPAFAQQKYESPNNAPLPWETEEAEVNQSVTPEMCVCARAGDGTSHRTMMSAVMDSLTHLFSSRRWPATRQRHSTAVNTQMDTTVPLLPPVEAATTSSSHSEAAAMCRAHMQPRCSRFDSIQVGFRSPPPAPPSSSLPLCAPRRAESSNSVHLLVTFRCGCDPECGDAWFWREAAAIGLEFEEGAARVAGSACVAGELVPSHGATPGLWMVMKDPWHVCTLGAIEEILFFIDCKFLLIAYQVSAW